MDMMTSLTIQDLAGLVDRQGLEVDGGGFSTIYFGYFQNTDEDLIPVAIKALRLPESSRSPANINKLLTYLGREATVWQRLCHENVQKFLGIDSVLGHFGVPALISPWCKNGTITRYLKKNPKSDRFVLMSGIIRGLEYLHGNKVVHGDMKPSNILISDGGKPLLVDFGCSRIIDLRGFTTSNSFLSERYAAPELVRELQHRPTMETDVYSFASTCLEVWSDQQPYYDIRSDLKLIKNIWKSSNPKPSKPVPVPPGEDNLWPIMEECWRVKPEERPSSQELRCRFERMESKTNSPNKS